MHIKTLSIPLLLLLGVAPLAAESGSQYTVRLLPFAWFAQAGGGFSYEDGGFPGSDFDAGDFEGLEDIEPAYGFEAGLQLPLLFDLHAGVFAFGVEGETNFAVHQSFGGEVFIGDTSAELELTDFYVEAAFRPLNLALGGVAIGVAIHAITGSVSLDSATASASFEDTAYVPVVSGRVFVNPLPGLSAEAKLHVMSVEIGDVDVQFLDVHVLVSYRPWENLGFFAGYRFIEWDIHYDFSDTEEADIDIDVGGFFGGLVLQF